MILIVLSRVLKPSLNRWFNLFVGLAFSLIQAGTLLDGQFTLHYLFFSIVEIGTTLLISWTAWHWRLPQKS